MANLEGARETLLVDDEIRTDSGRPRVKMLQTHYARLVCKPTAPIDLSAEGLWAPLPRLGSVAQGMPVQGACCTPSR